MIACRLKSFGVLNARFDNFIRSKRAFFLQYNTSRAVAEPHALQKIFNESA